MTNAYHELSRHAPRILLQEPYQAEQWCRRFDITEPELRLAIQAVGTDVQAVERFLSRPLAAPRWGERMTAQEQSCVGVHGGLRRVQSAGRTRR